MKKISPKSYFIGFLSGILLTLTGLFIAYYTDSKRVEIAEVVDSIPVDTFMYVTITDTAVLLHPDIQYRKEGQKPRQWNRELYYSDMDSITVAKWNSLSSSTGGQILSHKYAFIGLVPVRDSMNKTGINS